MAEQHKEPHRFVSVKRLRTDHKIAQLIPQGHVCIDCGKSLTELTGIIENVHVQAQNIESVMNPALYMGRYRIFTDYDVVTGLTKMSILDDHRKMGEFTVDGDGDVGELLVKALLELL